MPEEAILSEAREAPAAGATAPQEEVGSRSMAGSKPTVVWASKGVEQRRPLEPLQVCSIGRSSDSAIVLSDAMASREHAIIRRDGAGHCYLTDVGSRNGTSLNGRPLTSVARLTHGDRIRIGSDELLFEDPDGVTLPPPVQAAATQMFLANSLTTVMVVDVRGYTRLSQELGEEKISAVMSRIIQRGGDLLDRHRSWSQKYIGDAIMATWVHAGSQVTTAELGGVISVVGELRQIFDEVRAEFDLPQPLTFGCGVNTGYASIGNMGSAKVSDFTALGDTVNRAFRLETATKEVGCDILIAAAVLDASAPAIPRQERPPVLEVALKGLDQPERAHPLRFSDLPRLAALVAASAAPATLTTHLDLRPH